MSSEQDFVVELARIRAQVEGLQAKLLEIAASDEEIERRVRELRRRLEAAISAMNENVRRINRFLQGHHLE